MRKILLHLSGTRRRVVDPADIFWVEAEGHDTLVRLRSSRRLRDTRKLGELLLVLEPLGFVRVHDNHALNPDLVFEIRKRKRGQDWEARLAPPVNRVVPVSRGRLASLWQAYAGRSKS